MDLLPVLELRVHDMNLLLGEQSVLQADQKLVLEGKKRLPCSNFADIETLSVAETLIPRIQTCQSQDDVNELKRLHAQSLGSQKELLSVSKGVVHEVGKKLSKIAKEAAKDATRQDSSAAGKGQGAASDVPGAQHASNAAPISVAALGFGGMAPVMYSEESIMQMEMDWSIPCLGCFYFSFKDSHAPVCCKLGLFVCFIVFALREFS